MAVSDIATWGSSDPSVVTDTDVPSSSESLSFYSDDEIDFDDEFVVHGGAGPDLVTSEPGEKGETTSSPCQDEREGCEADAEFEEVKHPKRRRNKKKRWLRNILKSSSFDWSKAAAVGYELSEECETNVQDSSPHADLIDLNAMQQIIKEEGKIIVPASKVRSSVGQELERWKLAAENEHTKNFANMGAMLVSTPEDLRQH
jgi:hypothetical protein